MKLIGEGKYNLNAIKEIKVTDSYLGLDIEDRGCQNEEAVEECTTRQYIQNLRQKCGCLPFQIIASKDFLNVSKRIKIQPPFKILITIVGAHMFTSAAAMCCNHAS